MFARPDRQTTSLFGGVRDFFDSGVWIVVRNLGLFFAVVFWLASAYWVYKDARRRIEDPWLVGMATVLGLLPPFVGPLIYMLFRPPEYLEDVRERELEIRAMEERLVRTDLHCPVCRAADRGELPRLPGLHDQAQAGLPELPAAARAALADLPVLRDARRYARADRVRADHLGALGPPPASFRVTPQ